MSLTAQNPFSYAYDLIYAALTNWAPLMAQVQIGNVRNLDDPGYKPKPTAGATDRPELKILERKLIAKLFTQDARQVAIQMLYPIEIKSGQLGITQINLVSILTLQAITAVGPMLGDPGPSGFGFIQKAEWVDSAMVPKDPEARRDQWTVTGGVMVYFAFRRDFFTQINFT